MAARDNVIIRMSAEDAGAFEEWRKQARGPEMMGEAIEKAAQRGHAGVLDLTKALDHTIGKWLSIHEAIKTAAELLKGYYETKRELEQGEAHAAQTADAAMRAYFTNQRIVGAEAQAQSTERIGNVALRRNASLQQAGAAANLLSQFGVSPADAEGAALDELLQLQSATGSAGGNAEEMSRRVLNIIRRSMPGGKITPQNIRSIGTVANSLSNMEGFNDQTIDVFANVATELTKSGGYDYGTALALTTAVTGQYDPKQAKPMLRKFAQPGMQQGEAEMLAKARAMLGAGGGEKAYAETVQIGETGAMAMVRQSETGGVLGELEGKFLDREQIEKRLKASLRAAGVGKDAYTSAINYYENPWGPDWFVSDEGRVASAVEAAFPIDTESASVADAAKMQAARERVTRQALGQEQLPPIRIQLHNHEGREIPHSVEASKIEGR